MRILDMFFALRPLVLVPAWSFFVLGQTLVRVPAPFPWLRFILLSLVLAGVHLVNQVVDFESDRVNAKGIFLQRDIFSRRLYLLVACTCMAAGLAVAATRNASPGLLAAATALGLAYSLRPLRLAARPGLDLVANAAGYGGIALLLGAGEPALPPTGSWWPRLSCCMLAVGAVFLHTTLLDEDGDRRTGKTTTGVTLGPARTRAAAGILALAAAAVAVHAQAAVLLLAASALALLAVGAVAWPARVASRTVCVAGTAIFVLAAGWRTPLFLAGVLGLAVATRLYYKRRFDLAYPAL